MARYFLPKIAFFCFLTLLLFTPKPAKADLISPEYLSAHCKPNETEVTCSISGFASGAQRHYECAIYASNPNYYFLTSNGYSYSGTARYCKISSPFDNNFYKKFIVGLLLTLIIELVVLYLAGFRKKKSIILITISNLISFSAFQVIFLLFNFYGVLSIIIAEMLIVLFESIVINLAQEKSFAKTLLWVFIANLISAVGGYYILFVLSGFLK